MEKMILDGQKMSDKARAHRHIAQALSLPEYYGGNLDALWDCLTGLPAGSDILLLNSAAMLLALGDYGKRLLKTFVEAALENPGLSFETE